MRVAYPVIFTPSDDGYLVDVPDIDRQTQGKNYADAIYMARDLLGLYLIDVEDKGGSLPAPTPMKDIDIKARVFSNVGDGEVSMVDIDASEYRRKMYIESRKSVRRNITLPAWLDYEVKESKINVSKFVQDALIEYLGL